MASCKRTDEGARFQRPDSFLRQEVPFGHHLSISPKIQRTLLQKEPIQWIDPSGVLIVIYRVIFFFLKLILFLQGVAQIEMNIDFL